MVGRWVGSGSLTATAFYRRKYNAETTLARFGRDARDQVELSVLRDRLIEVTGETIQPQHISFWLRDHS